jgi:hypothetical protein
MGVKPFECPVIGMDCNRHQSGMRCPRGHAAFGNAFNSMPQPLQRAEVKSEYVSESRDVEGKLGGCGAGAPRNFF